MKPHLENRVKSGQIHFVAISARFLEQSRDNFKRILLKIVSKSSNQPKKRPLNQSALKNDQNDSNSVSLNRKEWNSTRTWNETTRIDDFEVRFHLHSTVVHVFLKLASPCCIQGGKWFLQHWNNLYMHICGMLLIWVNRCTIQVSLSQPINGP